MEGSWQARSCVSLSEYELAVADAPASPSCSQYRSQDKPYYRLGHAVSLGSMVWGICWMLVYLWIVKSRNSKKMAMTEEEKEQQDRDGVTGDRHWSFKYVF